MNYNLSEILDIAIGIEKSGFTFYTKASKQLTKYSDFFDFLAKEEVKHNVIFKDIKKENISENDLESIYDPDGIIQVYFDSLADSTIFKNDQEISDLFIGVDSIEEVIDWAIKREHDTILFFTGLKSTLDNKDDQKIVEDIIKEEMNHVHILMNKKSEIL